MAGLKGMFFATAGFFIVSLIIVLAIFVSLTVLQSTQRLAESGGLERINTLEKSLERTIASMDSGIEVSIPMIDLGNTTSTELNITETIGGTYATFRTDYYNSLLALESFIETDQPEIQIDPSVVFGLEEKIPILTGSQNIRYTHIDNGGKVGVKVTSGFPTYYYELHLNLPEETIDSKKGIEWITQATPAGAEYHTRLIISAEDKDGSIFHFDENLSITELNQFIIGSCNLDVNQISRTSLELGCDNTYGINLVLRPTLFPESLTARFPPGLVYINFSEIDIYKSRSVVLARPMKNE